MFERIRNLRFQRLKRKFDEGDLTVALKQFWLGELGGRYKLVTTSRLQRDDMTGGFIYYDKKEETFYLLETASSSDPLKAAEVTKATNITGMARWALQRHPVQTIVRPDLFQKLREMPA